jgi:transposase-like protein
MSNIDDLFCGSNAVSTAAVARAFDLSESNVRVWADELDVSKIGASFAWTRADVDALAEQLEASEEDSEDDGTDDDGDDADADAGGDDEDDEDDDVEIDEDDGE